MGRARKAGIDYFPVDVNLMSDTEIRVLFSKYGTTQHPKSQEFLSPSPVAPTPSSKNKADILYSRLSSTMKRGL